MKKNLNTPKYEFTDPKQEGNPVMKTISKTMVTTETFTMYDVLKHVAKMRKAIFDKRTEADGLENMLNEYLKEMAIVEETLGIDDLEKEFTKLEAEKAAAGEGETNG